MYILHDETNYFQYFMRDPFSGNWESLYRNRYEYMYVNRRLHAEYFSMQIKC
jgi:hypothetical protein